MCCRYGSGLHLHPVCTCLVDRHTKKCFIRPQKTLAAPPSFRHPHPTHCRIYRFHQRLLPLPPDCTLCPRQEPACVQPTARNLSWTSASTSSLLQHQSSRPTASPTHCHFDSASHRHVHHLFPTSDPTQHLELHWPCSLKMITGQPTTSCSKFETVRKRREGGMGGSGKRWCNVQSADRGETEKRDGILFELACGGGRLDVRSISGGRKNGAKFKVHIAW